MNDNTKATPGGIPQDPTPLAAKIGAANVAPKDPAGVRVTLDIEGGSAADRYEFHFEGTGSGDTQIAAERPPAAIGDPPQRGRSGRR